ncbi:S24 family peptidase [Advenella sp. EE-W14]|uniref:S24 family peptidase n=1 Tax=Advenella sp. EE-W14 TaxID=2722705 RepID=UPI00145D3F30|nr:S24 family peptidase [Advenella sp. EE-W14]
MLSILLFNMDMKLNNQIRLENLHRLINEAGTQEHLSDVSGVSRIYLNQIKQQRPDPTTGKTRNIGDSLARKLEKGMGKPVGWMDQDHSETVETISVTETEGYIRLDYLDIQSSAGHGKVADSYPPLIQNLNVLEDWALQSFGKNAVEKIKIINNSGDSMSPTIQDGDILFVDVSRRAFEAEGIYVLDWNGRLLTKRLVAQQDGRLAIISDNPSYQPEYINEKNIDSLVICGLVRGWWSFKRF